MSDVQQAAQKFRTLVPTITKFLEIGQALERIGSLESAAEGAQQREIAARQKAEAVEAEFAELLRIEEESRQRAARIVETATAEAAQVKKDAQATASRVLQEAEDEANAKVAEANLKAEATIARGAQSERGAMERATETNRRAIEVDEQIAAKRRELADIEGRVTRAKAEAQRIVEGR
jgi:hypothetical protein